MCEVGTLKELNVKPGDVVECIYGYHWWTAGRHYIVGEGRMVKDDTGEKWEHAPQCTFRIISRASDTPKLWRDMTDAEKGALLLAWHDGKVIEFWRRGSGGWMTFPEVFHDNEAYRVRPEPKIETVTMGANVSQYSIFGWEADTSNDQKHTHRITFKTINGKPDCASIKMEAL